MKANKFLTVALATLALVGFSACGDPNQGDNPDDPTQEPTLALNETSLTLEVAQTFQLTSTVKDVKWASSNDAVATVADGLVTAVSEGNSIITATSNGGQTKTCVVLVKKAGQSGGNGGSGEGGVVKGSQFWPIFMDEVTLEANKAKLGADFRYTGSDMVNFYFPWSGANYEFNDNTTGLNAAGLNEEYVSLIVTPGGSWAGGGIAVVEDSELGTAAAELLAAVVANPDQYYMHMCVKSADKASHCFYAFGCGEMSFVLGSTSVYDGVVYGDFTRDGSWAEFDIPLSQFATALGNVKEFKGTNIFVALSEYLPGAVLNLDLVYFYKK